MPLKLKRLEVEGFRAFDKRFSVEIGDGLTIIFGPPGSGKTSLVRALEFALFGMTRELPSRVLKREDLVNDFCEEARVQVVLTDGSSDICVLRTLDRDGRTTLVVTAGNNEFRDDIAERFLQSKLRCSLDEFAIEYSLGYQELYTLLHAPPVERGRLFDLLLGISELEKLHKEIIIKEVKDALKELEEEELRLGGEIVLEELRRLKGEYAELVRRRDKVLAELDKLEARRKLLEEEYSALQEIGEEASRLRADAERLKSQLRLFEDEKSTRLLDVDREYMLELAENLKNSLSELLEQCFLGGEAGTLKNFSVTVENLPSFLEISRRLLARINEECILRLNYDIQDVKNKINFTENQIKKLEDNIANLEYKIENMKDLRIEYEKIVKRHGDSAAIAKKIAQIEVKLKALQREESRSRCIHAIQEEIVETLKAQKAVRCPVCGKELSDFGSLPAAESSEGLALQREKLEKSLEELKEAERRLRDLEYSLKLLSDYEKRREELNDELERALDELEDLRVSLDELEERLSMFKGRLAELSRGYSQLESLYRRYRYFELKEALRKIESRLKELGYDEERAKRVAEDLSKVSEAISANMVLLKELESRETEIATRIREYEIIGSKLRELREKKRKLERILDHLERIRKALSDAHVTLRRSLAEKLSAVASKLFVELDPSMQYDSVLISVEGFGAQSSRGRYVPLVRRRADGRVVPAATRLSDGQKSILALSIFLASRLLKPQSLAFLILDDPLPNVDEATNIALAKALLRASRDAQIILTTQSKSVASELAQAAEIVDLHQVRVSSEFSKQGQA